MTLPVNLVPNIFILQILSIVEIYQKTGVCINILFATKLRKYIKLYILKKNIKMEDKICPFNNLET